MKSLLTTAVVMTLLDLLWLGFVGHGLYQEMLGPLLRPQPYAPAAALFYLMYVGTVWRVAVLTASSWREAAARGAAIGAFGYSVYELTNWAVLAGWPARLVPIDVLWGTVLTGLSAAAGAWVRGNGGGSSAARLPIREGGYPRSSQ